MGQICRVPLYIPQPPARTVGAAPGLRGMKVKHSTGWVTEAIQLPRPKGKEGVLVQTGTPTHREGDLPRPRPAGRLCPLPAAPGCLATQPPPAPMSPSPAGDTCTSLGGWETLAQRGDNYCKETQIPSRSAALGPLSV